MRWSILIAGLVVSPALAADPPKAAPPRPVILPPQVQLSLTPEQLDLIAKAIVSTMAPYEALLQAMQGQAKAQAVEPTKEVSGF